MKFTKMHGTGNDYVFVNCFDESVSDPTRLAKIISDRHFGVGSDGLILILPSKAAEVRMRVFNTDGTEAEMCGNGVRCLAKYVYERGIVNKDRFTVETKAGLIGVELKITQGLVEKVRARIGKPRLERGEIPMLGPAGNVILEPFESKKGRFAVTCLSMGNPHCVIYVEDVENFPVAEVGPAIESDARFPQRINVEFVEPVNRSQVRVRVWERGNGETLACGTGASAVCVAGVLAGKSERQVIEHLAGGDLEVEWSQRDGEVYLTGEAVSVFDGEWLLGET